MVKRAQLDEFCLFVHSKLRHSVASYDQSTKGDLRRRGVAADFRDGLCRGHRRLTAEDSLSGRNLHSSILIPFSEILELLLLSIFFGCSFEKNLRTLTKVYIANLRGVELLVVL